MLINNANITGSLAVVGTTVLSGSLAVSTLSGSGVRYLVSDGAGNMTAQTASAAIKNAQAYTASAGQTTFAVTNGYTTNLVDVYINGSKLLDGLEYNDTSGTNIVLTTGSFAGDIVEIVTYQPASGVTNNSLRTLTSFTATAGQTTFSASYVPGLLDVYYNGSRLNTIDYTAANGNSIILTTGSNTGDILDVLVYSYQVGAFSGIGGAGVTNQIAYWNTTNSITGSSNFTFNGSALAITGSFSVFTGSAAEFTVNATGVNLGNALTDSHVISGSLRVNPNGLFVSSSGNIGIGTTSPTDIAGYTSLTINNSSNGPLIDLNNSGTNNMRLLCLSAADQRIYGAGNLAFYTSGSNRMNITSTGNVGIGTTSVNASTILAVAGSNTVTDARGMVSVNSTNASAADLGGSISLGGENGLGTSPYAFAKISGRKEGAGATYSGYLSLATTFSDGTITERMRITSAGNVGIGTSSPSDLLTVAGTIVSSNATANTAINPGYIQANYPGNSNTAGSAVAHLRLGDTTNSRFWMQQIDTSYQYATFYFNGGVWSKVGYQTVGGTWTNSDERRKENIELSTYGLNEVLQLQPKKFNFKTDERKIINLGFIAQDVLPIIPEAVQTDIDDTEEYYAMNYANLVPVLVKALQEANAKITALEEKLERNNIQ
jgi:hypothetical protein